MDGKSDPDFGCQTILPLTSMMIAAAGDDFDKKLSNIITQICIVMIR